MTHTDIAPQFCDNPAINGRHDKFATHLVKVSMVVASWQESIFAYEWLNPDGTIKPLAAMSPTTAEKRIQVEQKLDKPDSVIERPVLGVGIMDNIEIGAGKEVFLTLAARGVSSIPVHIPKSHESDFRIFFAH